MFKLFTERVEDRVYALVAEERGIAVDKLTPNSMLSHDLGLDGDDAAEFFETFADEFGVDLAYLEADWHHYFSPEGVGLGTFLIGGAPPLSFALFLNIKFPKFPLWLAMILLAVLWWQVLYLWTRVHGAQGPQISIQDLIDCAKAGRWTKMLPAQTASEHNRAGKELQ